MPSDTTPLLPHHDSNWTNNFLDHRKLHTYHMLRALYDGYLPSTQQTIANLRAVLSSDVLCLSNQEISGSGRQLIRDFRSWIQTLAELLRDKNGDDQLQEFLWRVSQQSRPSLNNVSGIASRQVPGVVNTRVAYDSLHTIGHLLLTNAEFRLFIDDLATVGRQIFSDTSFALSDASLHLGKQVKPSQQELDAAHVPDSDEARAPSQDDIRRKATRIANATTKSLTRTGQEAATSSKENLSQEQSDILFSRLKQAVLKLRQQPGYSGSIEALKNLGQRYANAMASASKEAASVAEEDAVENEETKQTVQQFWAILRSFGDSQEWESLEQKFNALMKHANTDPEFQHLLSDMGSSLQEMMTNPDSIDSAPQKVEELTERSKQSAAESDLRRDVDAFLAQAKRTLQTVSEDPAISNLTVATKKLHRHALDAYHNEESSLPVDIAHIILPRLLRSVQYVPITRLEISSRKMDLLLENVVMEPGRTVNFSSFLPYRMHITTRNDVDVLKQHSKRVATDIKTAFTANILGLNVSASDFGFCIKMHTGLLRFQDEGIASFYLDKRGVDITLDMDVARDRLEQIFRLRAIRVHIHKFNYSIRQSRHSFLQWLLKPFIKPLLRRTLEHQLAQNIVTATTNLNRELVFARERLRAARIASPPNLATFVRAVLARGTGFTDGDNNAPQANADVGGIFRGIYTPCSMIREETDRGEEEIRQGDVSGGQGKTWRNAIFDVGYG